MVKEIRIEEVKREIERIETKQNKCREYLNRVKEGEEHAYDFLQDETGKIDEEFEACKDDEHPCLDNLIEERNQRLQQMLSECEDLLNEIADEQPNVNYQCSEKINELELEMRRLQMAVI